MSYLRIPNAIMLHVYKVIEVKPGFITEEECIKHQNITTIAGWKDYCGQFLHLKFPEDMELF